MKAIIFTCFSCLLLMQCSNQNSNSAAGTKAVSSSDANTAAAAVITPFKNIDVAQMKAVAENLGKDQVIIDVRTPDEINKGYIQGTMNINFYLADFEDKIKALDKDKEYYVYCRSGGRSAKASKLMNKLGFNKVYNLEGGYQAWEKNK